MTARIYRPARNAMQSGQAKDQWLLEYEPEAARQIEPLMGWTSSTDMRSQVKLKFDSKDEAIAYAAAQRRRLSRRGAQAADAQDRLLFRQFSPRPASFPGRTEAPRGRLAPAFGSVAQLDRAAAF